MIFVVIFLNDVLLRNEFHGKLRIYLEIKLPAAHENRQSKRKLRVVSNNSNVFAKRSERKESDRLSEMHVVAV